MQQRFRFLILGLALGLIFLGISANEAKANFIVETVFNGDDLFLENTKDITSGTGNVGSHTGPLINITTVGSTDFAQGNATLKPVKDGLLTSVIWAPENGNLFDDFATRGQLSPTNFTGLITLTVQDNQGDPVQTFTFTIDKPNKDFDYIGIVAEAGSGETIKWVRIESAGFKEVKQEQFSYAVGPPPSVPEPATLLLLGSGLVGVAVLRKRFKGN